MRGLVNLAGLLVNRRLNPEQTRAMQSHKLENILQTAWQVPYYQRLFTESGIQPGDIENVEDIERIPVTHKEDIQKLPASEITVRGADIEKCRHTRTSGATGTPLDIIARPADLAMVNPTFVRAYLAWGLKPWQRMTSFEARQTWFWKKKPWYQYLNILPCQLLYSGSPIEKIIKDVCAWKPHLMCGYSMTLKMVAEAFRNTGIRLEIPLVSSCSGVLDEGGRRLLEEVFGAQVIDIYASEEAGSVIAWECPDCGQYHVGKENVIVEILQDGRPAAPGEAGDVVITSFNNHTMPFIRYAQGDIAVPRPGRCAREPGAVRIHRICGREADFIVLPSGKRLTPHIFYLPFQNIVGVGQWRLIQKTIDKIEIQIVESENLENAIIENIARDVRKATGNEIDVHVSIVPELSAGPSGQSYKRRSVVSLL